MLAASDPVNLTGTPRSRPSLSGRPNQTMSLTFGKFLIRRELGRGAMGVVYEAEDAELGLDVALKVLTVVRGCGPESRRRQIARFYREARALAGMRHPNVVQVFDQGEIDGRHYLSMELVRGTNLRDRLQMQGPLSVPELTRLALEMCDALDYVHARWVVHRDIKPENLMLMPDGSSRLMDFGIALAQTEEPPKPGGGFEGSPSYMSPEQVKGEPVDGRTDIYSLGVTLYEAATGRRAVEGDTIPTIIHRVATEYPSPPAGLPLALQTVLMRAMAKDPAHRYRRAGEMADDIRSGRMPLGTFSPISTPAPPPRPEWLGAGEPTFPDVGGTRALPGVPHPWAGGVESSAQTGIATGTTASPGFCRFHPSNPGVGTCARCRGNVCHACLVEVPGRGILCRPCAFTPQ